MPSVLPRGVRHIRARHGDFLRSRLQPRVWCRSIVHLAEAGEYCAVTDRVFGLDEIVEAHRHVDTGRKRGNIVLRIA